MIWAAKPYRFDGGVRNHVTNRTVEFGFADFQDLREICRFRRVGRVGTPDATEVGIPNADESSQVKPGVEAAPDDSNSQPIFTHSLLHSIRAPGQGKRHVNPAGWFTAHLTAACGDHHKLSSLRFESCRRSVSGERQRLLPEQPPAIFVERSKLVVEICGGDKYEAAGGHDRATVVLASRIFNSFFDELRIFAKGNLPCILARIEIDRT
jgi:hypothetical protein